MTDAAKVSLAGKDLDYPVLSGSVGPDVVDCNTSGPDVGLGVGAGVGVGVRVCVAIVDLDVDDGVTAVGAGTVRDDTLEAVVGVAVSVGVDVAAIA